MLNLTKIRNPAVRDAFQFSTNSLRLKYKMQMISNFQLRQLIKYSQNVQNLCSVWITGFLFNYADLHILFEIQVRTD